MICIPYERNYFAFLMYDAPERIEEQGKECNSIQQSTAPHKHKHRNSKSFRTTSNEALCTQTGLTPLVVKMEEAAKLHNIVRKCPVHEFDREVQTNDWLHPTNTVRITEQQYEHAIQIFTECLEVK